MATMIRTKQNGPGKKSIMVIITSGEVREILTVPNKQGKMKPINGRTLDKIVEAGLLTLVGVLKKTGVRVFNEAEALNLKKRLPKSPLPSRYGIVNYLKGEFPERE